MLVILKKKQSKILIFLDDIYASGDFFILFINTSNCRTFKKKNYFINPRELNIFILIFFF
jgi:hypothetical protein